MARLGRSLVNDTVVIVLFVYPSTGGGPLSNSFGENRVYGMCGLGDFEHSAMVVASWETVD